MTLDDLEKISKIAFSGLGAFVLGYFTVTGKWNEFTLKEERFCVETESYYMQAALRSEGNPSEALLERIKERCAFGTLQEARQIFQAEKAGFQQLASDAALDLVEPVIEGPATGIELGNTIVSNRDGWVAIGRFDQNGMVGNFIKSGSEVAITADASELASGTVISAKWPVNLRQNTDVTTGRANPSLGILDTGACVKLAGETVTQRNIIWAPVVRAPCARET